MNKEKLDIVVPVYNEEESIEELLKRLFVLKEKMNFLDINFIFINDGSKDRTLEILNKYAQQNNFVKIINFSRNFGHQFALTAGVDHSEADFVAIIDADLQDPPELIEDMYNEAKKGCDIVYGKRLERKGETIFKKITAKCFYKFMRMMVDVDIPADTGDFRLINNKVLNYLKQMQEKHRFIRGMVPWIGFNSTPLYYNRDIRYAGETKYPLNKMLKFALDAIFSFSNKPLKLANHIGFFAIFIGVFGSFLMLYFFFFTDFKVPGITTTILTILIMGGIQILMLGIIGEYIGRIFEEVKARPLYVIESTKNFIKRG
ncbi:glycosyltransferase family 2 protein [bacterium]|jgi:polyisoprenyl-phosphate glycosyltransferase|nr:glycosyltransferase family 2 protein [bacterium]MBT3581958.1 glycosyltransferase family 2 protein [bacterium]MBT4551689.1 glycosyltransferase family 2 protein [bacterium]MBT7088512.1 glycosyltransferase family 2 protein [bacterium]